MLNIFPFFILVFVYENELIMKIIRTKYLKLFINNQNLNLIHNYLFTIKVLS